MGANASVPYDLAALSVRDGALFMTRRNGDVTRVPPRLVEVLMDAVTVEDADTIDEVWRLKLPDGRDYTFPDAVERYFIDRMPSIATRAARGAASAVLDVMGTAGWTAAPFAARGAPLARAAGTVGAGAPKVVDFGKAAASAATATTATAVTTMMGTVALINTAIKAAGIVTRTREVARDWRTLQLYAASFARAMTSMARGVALMTDAMTRFGRGGSALCLDDRDLQLASANMNRLMTEMSGAEGALSVAELERRANATEYLRRFTVAASMVTMAYTSVLTQYLSVREALHPDARDTAPAMATLLEARAQCAAARASVEQLEADALRGVDTEDTLRGIARTTAPTPTPTPTPVTAAIPTLTPTPAPRSVT